MQPCIFQVYVENWGGTGKFTPRLYDRYENWRMLDASANLINTALGVNKTR
jgi:hypothetical protein